MLPKLNIPVALLKEAHPDEYQTTTNDLDLQGKSHHSIYKLEQQEHSSCPNHIDNNNQKFQTQQVVYYLDWPNTVKEKRKFC